MPPMDTNCFCYGAFNDAGYMQDNHGGFCMILEKILIMALVGMILLTLDSQERKIHDLDKRLTRLESVVASNESYWKYGGQRCPG